MKAIVCHGPKDLRIEERETPVPGPGEVLVRIEAGGICGSDLHYFHDGGFGTIRISEPMILGHEVAGRVAAVGAEVTSVAVGDVVAVNPSRPCGHCAYCRRAQYNHCLEMRFYGSAMRTPHIQGAFRELLVAKDWQCAALPPGTSTAEAAFAEPLSVALHGVHRAGGLIGKRVLVTGTGPIGALAVAATKLHGALEVVATDIVDEALARAAAVGADRTINVATDADALAAYGVGKGSFDVVIEASGNERAMRSALDVIRPRGRLVQLGLGGEISLPQNQIVAKEIELCGSFRFHEEFAWAVALIGARRIPLAPLLTATFPVDDAVAAFESAGDRRTAMKVQIAFT